MHVSGYWSSESYEVEFPILSVCLRCPNIGTAGYFSKGGREAGGRGKSWSYPKHLGMEGDKVNSIRLIRGAFCVSHVGGKETRGGSISKK